MNLTRYEKILMERPCLIKEKNTLLPVRMQLPLFESKTIPQCSVEADWSLSNKRAFFRQMFKLVLTRPERFENILWKNNALSEDWHCFSGVVFKLNNFLLMQHSVFIFSEGCSITLVNCTFNHYWLSYFSTSLRAFAEHLWCLKIKIIWSNMQVKHAIMILDHDQWLYNK